MKKTTNIYNAVDTLTDVLVFVKSCESHCAEKEQIVEIKAVRKMADNNPNELGAGYGVQVTTITDLD